MADLDDLLLQAAGRTGVRKSTTHSRQSHYSSDESDSDPKPSSRRKPHQIPLKKRHDPPPSRSDDDLSDSDSAPSGGSNHYKDDDDKERLDNMTELQREEILYKRSIKADDIRLKNYVQESAARQEPRTRRRRSPSPPPPPSAAVRGRASLRNDKTAAAKTDALNELRAKRMMKDTKDRVPLPAPDSDESEGENKAEDDKSGEDNEMLDSLDDFAAAKSEVVKFEDIKAITIRRSKLAKWFMEPFFEELIVGCFVRVGIGKSKSGRPIYRLCMVKNVDATDTDRVYKLENRITYKYLNCVWGSDESAARWQMAMVSDGSPIEEEYNDWVKEIKKNEKNGARMLELKEVNEKKEEIQKKISSYVYSAATVKQMLQEKKSVSKRPLNIAAEKDKLRKEMEVAESRKDDAEIERIKKRFKELEEISRELKQKDSKAVRLAEMNRKNRAENFKNASEMKPVNTSLKAGEAGYDPFSRRWTRSTNYYVSKAAGENGEATAENGGSEATAVIAQDVKVAGTEAGVAATAAALEAAAGAGKLVDTSAPVDLGTESNTLHSFELPITLAGLQKFGGAQGVQAGFMARKQRIEATMGRKVPDNDGRRHALTLTVSDYKRRRGLL